MTSPGHPLEALFPRPSKMKLELVCMQTTAVGIARVSGSYSGRRSACGATYVGVADWMEHESRVVGP